MKWHESEGESEREKERKRERERGGGGLKKCGSSDFSADRLRQHPETLNPPLSLSYCSGRSCTESQLSDTGQYGSAQCFYCPSLTVQTIKINDFLFSMNQIKCKEEIKEQENT